MSDKLLFLHLSDIHFHNKISGGKFDLDADLRNELELDAGRMSDELGRVNAVLISGDIAFAGKEDEYDIAKNWLCKLVDLVKCDISNIWMVPGNHDVDRDKVKKMKLVKLFHEKVKSATSNHEIDTLLRDFLSDYDNRQLILSPMQAFNVFAGKFDCGLHKESPFCWESELFELNDGSYIKIRGLNSAIVSDEDDDDKYNKVVLGTIQSTLMTVPSIEYITLCHHPPQWLKDCESVEEILSKRVKIQLFGHKHHQKVLKVNNSIVVTAGAVHPDRQESTWEPRYNFLSIWVDSKDGERYLVVQVYPRVWKNCSFGPEVINGEQSQEFWLKLDRLCDLGTKKIVSPEQREQPNEATDEVLHPISTDTEVNPNRVIAYRFLTLSFYHKVSISNALGLLNDKDQQLTERDLFEAVFSRAKALSKLADLWDQVEAIHDDSKYPVNPYRP